MTILDEAITIIKGVARTAECMEIPTVRIVFDSPRDQASFKLELIKHLKPDDLVAAPIASKNNIDAFEIVGLLVELSNKERGTRATAEKITQAAEKALEASSRHRVTAVEIVNLRQAMAALLNLMRGRS